MKTKILALAAWLTMVCATAQAATVNILALNFGKNDFLVLGFAEYLSSTGKEYAPITGSDFGGDIAFQPIFPQVSAWLATVTLPRPPSIWAWVGWDFIPTPVERMDDKRRWPS